MSGKPSATDVGVVSAGQMRGADSESRGVMYLAERGCYESRTVAGVFDSPERAMGALPGNVWTKTTWTQYPKWPDRSVLTHWLSWDNDLDWDDAVTITEIDLTSKGPLRTVDRKLVQTLRESDGGWDYVPE